MNFIELYKEGRPLKYIAAKNECTIGEVKEAIRLSCGVDKKRRKISKEGEEIISERYLYVSLAQIGRELNTNLLYINNPIIQELYLEELMTLKYTVMTVDNSDECPCCKSTKWVRNVVLPETSGVQGTGKTKGLYCMRCGSEVVIRGNTANILNWDYVDRLYV